MVANPFASEFDVLLQQHTQGMDLARRREVLQQWLDDLNREGRVPTPGGWVSLTDRALLPGTPDLTHNPGLVRPSQRRMVILIGVAVMLVVLACLWMTRTTGGLSPSVVSTPVTAQDGATAPIALSVGDLTLPVRRFDPTQGWPDPSATADAALWGATTINVVLALDGRAHSAVLGDLVPGHMITLRRADGSVVTYTVTTIVVADAQAVEYAAQDHVGVTLVAMDGAQRLIIQALPPEAPHPEVQIAGGHVTIGAGQWTSTGAQLAVVFPVTVEAITAPLQILLDDLTLPVTTHLVIPAQRVTQPLLALTLVAGDASVSVVLAVPPTPPFGVQWQGVYRSGDGRSVLATALLVPDAPGVLTTTRGGCQVDGGSVQPLQVIDQALPLVLLDPHMVTVRCVVPHDARALTVWVDDQPIAVALPE